MTDFQSMSHQQMINWLDEASSFYVREAADRLAAAAVKLDEIAAQVKARPGRVEWQGEAEKAFMEWTANLASSTRSLSDFSENAAGRLRDVAVSIAAAQSAIPRYTSHAQAKENLEAAKKYHNDPDSKTVASNARSQMAEVDRVTLTPKERSELIAAKEEENRQAAAREMERLSSSYKVSGALMEDFPAPTFPPPPAAFVPDPESVSRNSSDGMSRSASRSDTGTTESTTTTTTTRSQDTRPTPDVGMIPPSGDKTGPVNVVRPEVPVDLGIDTVGTLPPPTTTTPPPTGTPPILGRPEPGLTPPLVVPPTLGTPPVSGGTGHTPPPGTRGPVGPTGRTGLANPGPLGGTGMPRDGISGGRQVSPTTGRPTTGFPRSTVIGTEHGQGTGRMPMGGGGGHLGGTHPGGQNGISGGRRLAVETGGVVGGRPTQPGATSARPFTPGGSGLVRAGGAQGGAGTGTGPMGRGVMPAGTNGAGSRREDSNGERPDYLVEDEETWQQGGRRVAPPVID
ncbi:hypothetical protein ACFVZW_26105 [Streptomyces sp. NPDC059567]|uniref:hypothetical protein n=1 Tax=Streptomyces sp. NPDC059567 TaxID=3346867 RepID=UPI0036A17A26